MSPFDDRTDYALQRAALVKRLRSGGIGDEAVLRAFGEVPRHSFVPAGQREFAYQDRALPLSDAQTISQPSMIAIMLQELALTPTDVVLEVGAGSGYAAAIISRIVRTVHAVEIRPALAALARHTLAQGPFDNVHVYDGDGRGGLGANAPFDAIVVSAGAAAVPPALLSQLGDGGRIAIPVGSPSAQTLRIGERRGVQIVWRSGVQCLFVPLVGAHDA